MSSYYIWVNGDFVHPKRAPAGIFAEAEDNFVSFIRDFRVYQTDSGPAIFQLAEYVREFMNLVRKEMQGVHLSEAQVCDSIHRTIVYNGIQEGWVRTRLLVKNQVDRDHTGLMLAVIPQDTYDRKRRGTERKPAARGIALQNDVPRHASLFLVKDRVIHTPPSKVFGNEMVRSAVITLAQDMGYEVRETQVSREQIAAADEVFLSTAVGEVEHVSEFDGRAVGERQPGPITRSLQNSFYSTMQGRGKRSREWLDWIGEFFLGI